MQDEIAGAVVDALRIRLVPGSTPTARGLRTADPEVYRLVLLGRELSRRGSMAGWSQALEVFEQALALDPLLRAGLGRTRAADPVD